MPKIKKTKVTRKYVPYASGFRPPNKDKQLKAIGFDSGVPLEYHALKHDNFEFFKPVPKPTTKDDWLAQYNEEGQTYKQFLQDCPWISSRKRKSLKQRFVPEGTNILEKYPDGKIYIVPVGKFDGHHYFYFDELAKFAEIYLGVPVSTLPAVDLDVKSKDRKALWVEHPSEASQLKSNTKRGSSRTKQHTLESRFKGTQYQLGVKDLLKMLHLKIPNDAICLIGLTMSDLFCDDTDLFVAGMAAGNHRVAIFSFYRYNPTLSFSPADWFDVTMDKKQTQENIRKIMFQRSCKLLVHEINHLLGIDHCIFYDCCMNGSGHLSEDFRQPMHLCPVDLHKLQKLVGFNILIRYNKLLKFYENHDMEDEREWVSKRIKMIGQISKS